MDALVVGASGFLGREVAARLRAAGHDVTGTYCSRPDPAASTQFDVWTDDPESLVRDVDPDAVVFAAAVEYGGAADSGETGVDASFERRADQFAAAVGGLRFVYVSSAAVFDGEDGRYAERDPRSPRDDYGRRLVAFEDAVDDRCSDAVVFRSSYLFGLSRGELDDRLSRTRESIRAGESVAYFGDMYKSPLDVTEAASAIQALLECDATGVVHAPAPRTSVAAFHRHAMAALGYDTSLVESEKIPAGMDVAPDRSLTSDRFDSLVGFEPSTVSAALADADSASGGATGSR